uniref:Replication associated protein n=1 Tax=Antarctic circular DNA molecule TaxID=2664238 RepID=A0A5Q2F089_9ZZZZ|nr:replication associated protein [Antarctic circular DNA molecule]
MTARNYVFTKHFTGNDEISAVDEASWEAGNLSEHFSDPLFKYVIVNVERCPQTEGIHWQGYTELTSSVRFTQVKAKAPILADAHFERRRGTRDEAREYCMKEDTQIAGPFEYGVFDDGQGTRSDLAEVAKAIAEGASELEISQLYPEHYIRYHKGIKALMAMQHKEADPDPDFVTRPWQEHLMALLTSEVADDRTIYWVTDTIGGKGKTRLATHLISMHHGFPLSGKMPDMVYAYMSRCNQHRYPRVAIFDISRAAQEYSGHLYSMAEHLKSGRLFNTKWESQHFTFPTPHVVFFSNTSWDRSKLSLDRVVEIDLNNPMWL